MIGKDAQKRLAAQAALEHVVHGRPLGVGTGSTTNHFIDLLADDPRGRAVPAAVASSVATAERLRARGFRVVDLDEVDDLPVYVDGADEVDPALCLIKGGGGALTREKVVAEAARTFVCVVDASKRVERLGAFPLPVEVIPMARALVARKLRALGAEPRLRLGAGGAHRVTDNGNVILDAAGLAIDDPRALEAELDGYPGVVSTGLFARRRADLLLAGQPDGTVTRLDGAR